MKRPTVLKIKAGDNRIYRLSITGAWLKITCVTTGEQGTFYRSSNPYAAKVFDDSTVAWDLDRIPAILDMFHSDQARD